MITKERQIQGREVALCFNDNQTFQRAAERLWSDDLRDIPFELVGQKNTFIIPASAEKYFKDLLYESSIVLRASELPPYEIAKLRAEQGPY